MDMIMVYGNVSGKPETEKVTLLKPDAIHR
jgi:hypothetical protein